MLRIKLGDLCGDQSKLPSVVRFALISKVTGRSSSSFSALLPSCERTSGLSWSFGLSTSRGNYGRVTEHNEQCPPEGPGEKPTVIRLNANVSIARGACSCLAALALA